ncbi:unnamed protein product [Cylindrotheca closterium]|uniref:Uncharacterized protein n=1 Tax=Cylindrotheca closterium TaxID=2856 RepID=A0AAD2FZV0_9STRA|nr:unnamed protein product [Cylindrotheca closterium]
MLISSSMKLFPAVLLVSSCFQASDAHLHAASLESNVVPSSQGAHSLTFQSDESSHLLLPPSSPDCWLETFEELYPQDLRRGNHHHHHHAGQPPLDFSTCVQMDTHHQQALALRLTKCHLESVGRSLETTTTTEDGMNACEDLLRPSGIKDCLSNLSTTAVTIYAIFFKDLHYVCTRLLQESVTNRYYQTAQDLEQVSKLAEDRLLNILQQFEDFSVFWKEKEESMVHWFHEQAQLSANQALEFQEQMQSKQHEDLHRHKEELQSLADALQTTKASIQPWTQLVGLVFRYIPIGYSIIKIVATMVGTMMIIMILTPHKELRRTRLKLFVVVLLGGLGRMVLLWLENEDEIGFTDTERLEISEGLQNFLMSFLFACYLSGLSSFCCGWNKNQQDDNDDDEDEENNNNGEEESYNHISSLQRENDLMERLRLYSYQQQHWNATLVQQQRQQQHEQREQATLPNVDVRSILPPRPFLMTSSATPPPLIHSPESGSFASVPPIVAAPWNASPSPWTPHCPIPVYPDEITSDGYTAMYVNNNQNSASVLPTVQETIDLPPDERDDEEESDGTRDDTGAISSRKRTCLEMEESADEDLDAGREVAVAKKRRIARPKKTKS